VQNLFNLLIGQEPGGDVKEIAKIFATIFPKVRLLCIRMYEKNCDF